MSQQEALKVHVLPARQGLTWLSQSLALVRQQLARLLFLGVLLQLILGLSQIPLLGFFVMIAMPAFSAGLLQAFFLVSVGQRPPASTLFVPLTSSPRTGRLLALGGVMVAVGLVTVSLLLSGSESLMNPDLVARIEEGDLDAVAMLDEATVMRILLAIAVAFAVSGTLTFMSIPLIWFGQQKLGSSLASGLRALVANWKPFGMLALGYMALMVPLALVMGMLYRLAATSGGLAVLVVALMMLLMLAFQLVVFASQFCSFRDIFRMEAAAPPKHGSTGSDDDSGGDDGQLLA